MLGWPWSAHVGLRRQHGFQYRLVLALALGRFEQLHHLVGPLVKRRVADDEPHVVGVLRHQALDDRIERAAGLAGGVEELDDRDRRALRAEHR